MDHSQNINFINQDSSGSLFTDASIFADNRYSGYDLWADGSFADYGAEWSAIDGNRRIEIFAGQSYDFYRPRELDPNSGFRFGGSDFVGRLRLRANDLVTWSNRFRFDRDTLDARHLESDIRLGGRNFINIGFIRAVQFDEAVLLNHKTSEIVAGFGVSASPRLRVNYNMTYNITDNRVQTRNVQMMYDHPCYSIGLTYSEDRSETLSGILTGGTSYKIQFNLKIQGS
jgi:LPS-assembly protein